MASCPWPIPEATPTSRNCESFELKVELSLAPKSSDTISYDSFITYRSCKHLDGKHTVFGRLVGGIDTLNAMERIGTDNKDRPVEEIVIEQALVFTDPYAEVDEQVNFPLQFSRFLFNIFIDFGCEQLVTERAAAKLAEQQQKKVKTPAVGAPTASLSEKPKAYKSSGVGKYINPQTYKK